MNSEVEKPSDTILQNVEQITTLEELHKSIRVITIKGWVALLFIAAFFLCVLIWSFAGRLPMAVSGKAVYLQDQTILGFFPLYSGQQIKEGMLATVSLDSVNTSRYGRINGVVRQVYTYPVSAQDPILEQIPSMPLREYLVHRSLPTILVEIEPIQDPNSPTGLEWSSKEGPSSPILEGSVGEVEVTLKVIRPINYVIPKA